MNMISGLLSGCMCLQYIPKKAALKASWKGWINLLDEDSLVQLENLKEEELKLGWHSAYNFLPVYRDTCTVFFKNSPFRIQIQKKKILS